MAETTEQPVPALGGSVKFAFGLGQMAEGIKNASFSVFLLFYYNQVLGLSADAAGLAIGVSLIFDAVTDPVAGTASDRWRSAQGRRHPFMYASALPLAIAFYFLFAPAAFALEGSQTALFLWMLTFTVLTRGAMTLYHVPHLALGAELSTDYEERTAVVAIRQFMSGSGHLLVYGLGFAVFFAPTEAFPNGQLNAGAYPPFAITLAVLMATTIFYSAWGTRSRIPYLPKAQEKQSATSLGTILGESGQALKNRSLRWLMLGYILIVIGYGIGAGTGLYTMTFFWELSRFQVLCVLLTGPFGSLVGYVVAGRLFAWLDKRNAMITGAVTWALLHALPVGLYLLGLPPASGTWALAILLALIYLAIGASVAQVFVGISTLMADIADENALETGARQEGVLFGAVSFASKCTSAAGAVFAGALLKFIDWPTGETIRSAADVPPDVLLSMAILSGPFASLIAIPGVACLLGYRLNRARTLAIQAQLDKQMAQAL